MPINEILFNLFWITIYIFILIAFFYGLISWLIGMRRKKNISKFQYDVTFMQILLPQQDENEIEAMEHLLSSLAGLRKGNMSTIFSQQHRISFEIVSKNNGIGFYVVVPDELLNYVEKQINSAYPNAEIDLINPNEVWDRGSFTAMTEIKISGAPYFPITTHNEMNENDPLNGITSAMSKLREDEVVAIQYLVSPAGTSWQRAGRSYVSHIKSKSADSEKGHSVDTSLIEGVEQKIKKPGFDVKIRVVSIASDVTTANAHLDNVANAFEQFAKVNYNRFRRSNPLFISKAIDEFIFRRMRIKSIFIPIFDIYLYRNASILNSEELSSIFHFPNVNVRTPNIMYLKSRKAAAPANIPQEGLYLGQNVFRGVTTKVHMKPKDRTRHFYIIGQTGTGKSVFMSSLALQDIYNGHGIAYIDPHGSEIDKLLEEIPEHRKDDVILWDVSDTERPFGLNILEARNDKERNMAVNAFIALLYKLYDPNGQGIVGPQLERTVRNMMLTAMYDPNSSLVDVMRLVIDPNYSKKYLPLITDPLVMKYWTDEVANTSAQTKGEKMGYFVSKFDRFVTEKMMRNIIGQPKSSFNIADVMSQRKILLVNLSKGKIGEENTNFLGLLLVPKILTAALSRAELLGKEDFPDFFLYVDEFQNFATPDFATILSEARKYKLNLTVAHQFIAQLSDEIKEAVFGNVGSMAVFRISPEDAEFVLPQFEPTFGVDDIIKNPIGNAYMKLLVDGYPTPPFSMRVDYEAIVDTPKSKERAASIVESSRMKYGRDVKEVERYINQRAGLNDPQKPSIAATKDKPPLRPPLRPRPNIGNNGDKDSNDNKVKKLIPF